MSIWTDNQHPFPAAQNGRFHTCACRTLVLCNFTNRRFFSPLPSGPSRHLLSVVGRRPSVIVFDAAQQTSPWHARADGAQTIDWWATLRYGPRRLAATRARKTLVLIGERRLHLGNILEL